MPTQNHRASLLLLNWRRMDNLKHILDVQAEYECIDEILVFNNNRAVHFEHQHPKIKVLNASADFGLRSRWILAALARNPSLVLQDDDILLPEIVFVEFIKAIVQDGERAYSLHGRDPDSRCEYNSKSIKGEAEIVLTRATCIHKAVVPLIFQQEARLSVAGYALPTLNGEDIFLSYCLTGHFGKRHKILELPSTELPAPHSLWTRSDHFKQRTLILRQCRQFFLPATAGKTQ